MSETRQRVRVIGIAMTAVLSMASMLTVGSASAAASSGTSVHTTASSTSVTASTKGAVSNTSRSSSGSQMAFSQAPKALRQAIMNTAGLKNQSRHVRASASLSGEQVTDPGASGGYDGFGGTVAISGTNAVIGSWFTGQAYFYSLRSGSWSLVSTVTDPGAYSNDYFGQSVSISGTNALISAPGATVNGHGSAGAAYFYSLSSGSWSLVSTVTDPNASNGDYFSYQVAISGTNAVIGAASHTVSGNTYHGAAYFYSFDSGTWTLIQTVNDPGIGTDDQFGQSVSISGTNAVVGAGGAVVNGADYAGKAYFYSMRSGSWSLVSTVADPGATSGDFFAYSLSVSGTNAVIGAVGTAFNQGAAYFYSLDSGTWTLTTTLSDPGAASPDQFAYAVSISGTNAVIGAWQHTVSGHTYQGAAYFYSLDSGAWTLTHTVDDPETGSDEQFGTAVAISDTTAIVGNWGATVSGSTDSGSAWKFSLGDPTVAVTAVADHASATVLVGDSYTVTASSNDSAANFGFAITSGGSNCSVGARTGVMTFSAATSCTVTITVTAGGSGYSGVATATEVFTINKKTQTITLGSNSGSQALSSSSSRNVLALASIGATTNDTDLGSAPRALPATSSYFSVNGGSTNSAHCSIVGSKISFTSVGVCTIDVNAGATANFNAADRRQFSLSIITAPIATLIVLNIPQNISRGPAGGYTYYGNEDAVVFSGFVQGDSNVGNPLGSVNIYSGTTLLCTSSINSHVGAQSFFSCSPTSTRLPAGLYTYIYASYVPGSPSVPTGNRSYLGSTSRNQTLTISTITVVFNKNSSSAVNTMASQSFTGGLSQALRTNNFSRQGHTFRGWALTATGSVRYTDQQSVTLTASLTLYAVWS